jgi:hypothetical protein
MALVKRALLYGKQSTQQMALPAKLYLRASGASLVGKISW